MERQRVFLKEGDSEGGFGSLNASAWTESALSEGVTMDGEFWIPWINRVEWFKDRNDQSYF